MNLGRFDTKAATQVQEVTLLNSTFLHDAYTTYYVCVYITDGTKYVGSFSKGIA